MKITRRHLLAATGAVSVAGTLSVGGTLYSWWDRPPGEGLSHLSLEEWNFVQALGEAWMPPGGNPALSGAEARVGDFLDEVVGNMATTQGKLLRVLIRLLDHATLPTRGARFASLDLSTRTEVLTGWVNAPTYLQRQAVGSVLVLVAFGYTRHPEVAPSFRHLYRCGYGP
jgi:hypothetical protein